MFTKKLRRAFPVLGRIKRYSESLRDTILPAKTSYSQHSEDSFILDFLRRNKVNSKKSIYCEVGAFSPTKISNTYLLYRNGFHGVLIEPNRHLCKLIKKFRKNDVVLNTGVSNRSGIMKFHISRTPDRSSLDINSTIDVRQTTYVPVLTLDETLQEMDFEFISFLSIDIEGNNEHVLEGAYKTLEKTLILCIEYYCEEDKMTYRKYLKDDFKEIAIYGCNILYLNNQLLRQLT